MGTEFIPSLDEGDVAVQALRVPGTSLTQSVEMQAALEKRLMKIPEVKEVFARIGNGRSRHRPDAADDRRRLRHAQAARTNGRIPRKPKAELVAEIEKAAEEIPGNTYELTQPIQMRFNELISGVRSDVGVKIFGDDLDTLLAVAGQVQAVLQTIPGAADVKTEQVAGLPMLTVKLNRPALARYGISVADVQEIVEIAVGGKEAGHVFEGDRRFEIVVRLPEHLRIDIEAIKALPIPVPETQAQAQAPTCARCGPTRRWRRCATSRSRRSPRSTSRPDPTRSAARTASGASWSAPTCAGATSAPSSPRRSRRSPSKVKLPAGYWIGWGGQFEQLASATKRLTIVVPIALLLIFLLLFMSLGSAVDAAARVQRRAARAHRRHRGAAAARHSALDQRRASVSSRSPASPCSTASSSSRPSRAARARPALVEAVREGALMRCARADDRAGGFLGFVPMAIATGAGAEVQRPLATVVIGGIISSTVLTLFVLPALYVLFRREPSERRTARNCRNPQPRRTNMKYALAVDRCPRIRRTGRRAACARRAKRPERRADGGRCGRACGAADRRQYDHRQCVRRRQQADRDQGLYGVGARRPRLGARDGDLGALRPKMH